MKEFIKVKERLFKPIKELDAEIRFIENEETDSDKTIYWVVEVGFCESIGERGYNYTFFYDSKPTEKEITSDAKAHIVKQIQEFEEQGMLNATEERQFEALKKLELV